IRAALRRISDFLAVDWGCLTEYSHDRRTARITHSWVADGVGPQPSALGFDELPWVVRRLQRDEVVRFSRLSELPSGPASVDRRTFLAMGIKSQVAVPLIVEGT